MVSTGLYVHVPFCVHKCGYCDFNSWAEENLEPQLQWQQSLEKQTQFWGNSLLQNVEFNTLFFGGGTPSLLKPEPMFKAIESIKSSLRVAPDAEWTFECNPETISVELLERMWGLGVNRISLGIQSFQDLDLERLERRARRNDNIKALELIQKYWPGRWSMDLMFGLPSQSAEQWRHDLKFAMEFNPSHISAYQLTLTTARSKNWKQADNDTLLEMFLDTEEILSLQGLKKYEVSNFSKPGQESQHNLKYWRLEPFLGLGPGASGLLSSKLLPQLISPLPHLEGPRLGTHGAHQKQPDSFEKWRQSSGHPREELLSHLTPRNGRDHLQEILMMGLRLREGLNEERLDSHILNPNSLFSKEQELENIEYYDGYWRCTQRGERVLDTVLQRLFAEIDKNEVSQLDFGRLDPKF